MLRQLPQPLRRLLLLPQLPKLLPRLLPRDRNRAPHGQEQQLELVPPKLLVLLPTLLPDSGSLGRFVPPLFLAPLVTELFSSGLSVAPSPFFIPLRCQRGQRSRCFFLDLAARRDRDMSGSQS